MEIKKTVLENGLVLMTEVLPQFESVAIGAGVRLGSQNEAAPKAGVSHFLEHMVFKGTATRDAFQIVRDIEQLGGEFNAFTGRDMTCLHVLVPKRGLKTGLDILADVILNSKLDAAEMKRERQVILQEISMVEESPEELAFDLFYERVYGREGLGSPIAGTRTTVRNMRRRDLAKYYHGYYRPEQTVISVVGDVDPDQVHAMVQSLLGKKSWPGRDPSPEHKFPGLPLNDQPPPFKSGRWWIEQNSEQAHLVWGFDAPHGKSPLRIAANLLQIYLGGGMSSALFQEVREKHALAYSVYATYAPHLDSGCFLVYAATRKSKVNECLKLIEGCVRRLAEKPLTESEFRKVQENLKGTLRLSVDSSESRMLNTAQNELIYGVPAPIEEICALIDQTKRKDLSRLARAFLADSRQAILGVGPGTAPSSF